MVSVGFSTALPSVATFRAGVAVTRIKGVVLGSTASGETDDWVGDWVVTAAGAHEANRRASRLKLVLSAVEGLSKMRVLIVIPL
jgi:hypothetical protein